MPSLPRLAIDVLGWSGRHARRWRSTRTRWAWRGGRPRYDLDVARTGGLGRGEVPEHRGHPRRRQPGLARRGHGGDRSGPWGQVSRRVSNRQRCRAERHEEAIVGHHGRRAREVPEHIHHDMGSRGGEYTVTDPSAPTRARRRGSAPSGPARGSGSRMLPKAACVVGRTCTNPASVASVAVTFSTTAEAPEAAHRCVRRSAPARCRRRASPAPACACRARDREHRDVSAVGRRRRRGEVAEDIREEGGRRPGCTGSPGRHRRGAPSTRFGIVCPCGSMFRVVHDPSPPVRSGTPARTRGRSPRRRSRSTARR